MKANTITSLIIPVEGIDRVTNFDPMVLGVADETDDDLRQRAKQALKGLGAMYGLCFAADSAREGARYQRPDHGPHVPVR